MHLIDLIVSCSGWAWHTTLIMLPVMALLLLLGRWRSFPARWRLVLAGVVAVRLLLPMVPAVAWHPWSKAKAAQVVTIEAAFEAPEVAQTLVFIPESASGCATAAAPIAWSSMLAVVWLSGVMLTGAWVLASHLRLRALIQTQARPASEEVRSTLTWSRKRMGLNGQVSVLQVTGLPTMALWGWLTPRVLVPHDVTERYSQAEMRGMLLHELAHLRRRDGLWIWLGLAVCALHWFNPLAWLCLRRYLADRELECDRAALDHLPEPDRLTYGHALLKTLAGNTGWSFATCTPFARSTATNELKHRITMIAQPLNSRWGRAAALLTVPLLALGTLTTAADEEGKKPATEEGKASAEREGGARKSAERDGEGTKKTGARDGEGGKTGPRDGEKPKTGARDGEGGTKTGARDGEGTKTGVRDGEGKKSAEREGGGKMREGGEGKGAAAPATAASSQAMVIQVNGEGNVVNSKGEVIPINQVRGKMKDIADANPNQSITLRAAADTPYAKVLNVLDALKDSGLKDVKMEQAQ